MLVQVFQKKGERKIPSKTSWSESNPHMTLVRESYPGHVGGKVRRVLSHYRHSCRPLQDSRFIACFIFSRYIRKFQESKRLYCYFFSLDINDCVNHSCRNGGGCVDGLNNYSCVCKAGFSGARCEVGKIRTLYSNYLHSLKIML